MVAVEGCVENALDSLIRMRKLRVKALRTPCLKGRIISGNSGKINRKGPEVPAEYKTKLTARIAELLDQQPLDENRLAAEVAILPTDAALMRNW